MNIDLRRRTDEVIAVSLSSGTLFDVANKRKQRDKLTKQMGGPNFWDNQEKAQQIIAQLKPLNGIINPFEALPPAPTILNALCELCAEDESLEGELRRSCTRSRRSSTSSSCAPCYRPARCLQRLRQHQRRHRRHRSLRLGRDAPAHVHALGGAPRLRGRNDRRARKRRGRHPQRHHRASAANTPTAICKARPACIAWCASARSTPTSAGRPRSPPWT